MIRCQRCGATTSNGLWLCELCLRLGAGIFDMLPVYFRNLARQRRPGRPNGSLGTSGTWLIRRGETEGSKVTAALERVVNDLDTWARCLTDDRDIRPDRGDTEAETVVALCRFLEANLTSIATLDWAGQFLRDMDRHERTLRALTESVVPGWYAGTCRQVTGRTMEGDVHVCGAELYVVPGLTWVVCQGQLCPTHRVRTTNEPECLRCTDGCGATTHASDHLATVLQEASDWTARPKAIAETLVALLDAEPSVPRLYDRIRKWESLGWLASIRRHDAEGDPTGAKMYRLGDVYDLATSKADGTTRNAQRTG